MLWILVGGLLVYVIACFAVVFEINSMSKTE